jgi:hypothetical protein
MTFNALANMDIAVHEAHGAVPSIGASGAAASVAT